MVSMTKEYRKAYYEKNKKKIQETMNKEIECDVCHKKIKQCRLNRHQQTKKCKDSMREKESRDLQEIKKEIDELRNLINQKISK